MKERERERGRERDNFFFLFPQNITTQGVKACGVRILGQRRKISVAGLTFNSTANSILRLRCQHGVYL